MKTLSFDTYRPSPSAIFVEKIATCNKKNYSVTCEKVHCLSYSQDLLLIIFSKLNHYFQLLDFCFENRIMQNIIRTGQNESLNGILDVTLNLKDWTSRPYKKPDKKVQCIHTWSNHSLNISKYMLVST